MNTLLVRAIVVALLSILYLAIRTTTLEHMAVLGGYCILLDFLIYHRQSHSSKNVLEVLEPLRQTSLHCLSVAEVGVFAVPIAVAPPLRRLSSSVQGAGMVGGFVEWRQRPIASSDQKTGCSHLTS
jgi:hypothetical protein